MFTLIKLASRGPWVNLPKPKLVGSKGILPTSQIHTFKSEWNEFLKYNNKHNRWDILYDNEILGRFDIGSNIFNFEVGSSLTISSNGGSGITTSLIVEIISPNMFITANSIYFIIDESWIKKEKRNKKLNKLLMSKFEEVWSEVAELDKEDNCLLSEAVCKFVEEFGELTTEINKVIGRKTTKETSEEVRANVLQEAADSLQNFLLICNRLKITPDELLDEVRVKNKKWKSVIPDRQKQKIEL